MRLNRIIIFVADVEKVSEFYETRFDLPVIESTRGSKEWRELDAGGIRLAFHQAYGPQGPVLEATGSEYNPHKIVFYVENIRESRETLISKGVDMGEIQNFGNRQYCDGSDPEGHRFQICNE
ncbi:MAG: VOC family protein [bacterium]|jgi:catechol 2,3-dioxygenase-like lactoylglutathione lyase family enzyme|nr:VOC family protein [bacterium]